MEERINIHQKGFFILPKRFVETQPEDIEKIVDKTFPEHSGYLIERPEGKGFSDVDDCIVWVWRYNKQGRIFVHNIPMDDSVNDNNYATEKINAAVKLNGHARLLEWQFGWNADDIIKRLCSCRLIFQFM